jgi:hypothetical protein
VLIILICPAGALTAEYRVMPGGNAYTASVTVIDSAEYGFWAQGMLGERIPMQVEEISIIGEDGAIEYSRAGSNVVTFPVGNYTINYGGPIRNNHLQVTFEQPYNLTVLLPEGLDVRNPMLGVISHGGVAARGHDGAVSVTWNQTTFAEFRFYDPLHETLLSAFGTIWIIAVAIFVFPYLVGRRKKR